MKKLFQILFFELISFSVLAHGNSDSLSKKCEKWELQLAGGVTYAFPKLLLSTDASRGMFREGIGLSVRYKINRIIVLEIESQLNYLEYKTWLSYSPMVICYYKYALLNNSAMIRLVSAGSKMQMNLGLGANCLIMLNNELDSNKNQLFELLAY